MKLFEEYIEEIRRSLGDDWGKIITQKKMKELFICLTWPDEDVRGYGISDEESNYIRDNTTQEIANMLHTTKSVVKNLIGNYAMVEQDVEKASKTLRDFLMNLNSKRFETAKDGTIIGSGAEGFAIRSNDKVIKFYYNEMPKDAYNLFLTFKEPHNVFPRVYRVSRNWVCMEKLEKLDANNRKVVRDLCDACGPIDKEHIENLKRVNGKLACDDEESLMTLEQWSKDFDEEFNANEVLYDVAYAPDELDWHMGNFAQRKNGEIVFFDPYYFKGWS